VALLFFLILDIVIYYKNGVCKSIAINCYSLLVHTLYIFFLDIL